MKSLSTLKASGTWTSLFSLLLLLFFLSFFPSCLFFSFSSLIRSHYGRRGVEWDVSWKVKRRSPHLPPWSLLLSALKIKRNQKDGKTRVPALHPLNRYNSLLYLYRRAAVAALYGRLPCWFQQFEHERDSIMLYTDLEAVFQWRRSPSWVVRSYFRKEEGKKKPLEKLEKYFQKKTMMKKKLYREKITIVDNARHKVPKMQLSFGACSSHTYAFS